MKSPVCIILAHLVASLVFRFRSAYRSLLSLLFSGSHSPSSSVRSSTLFSTRPCLTYFDVDEDSYLFLKRSFEERGVHCMAKQLQPERREEVEPLLPPFSTFPVLEANGMVVSDRKTILRYADDVVRSEKTASFCGDDYDPISRLLENHWIDMHTEFVSPMRILSRMKASHQAEGERREGTPDSESDSSCSFEGWIVSKHAPAYLRYLDDHLSGSNPVFHLTSGREESTAETLWTETLFLLLFPSRQSHPQSCLERRIASIIEGRFPNVMRYALRRKEMEEGDDASTTSTSSLDGEEEEEEDHDGKGVHGADEPEIMLESDNVDLVEEKEAKKDI